MSLDDVKYSTNRGDNDLDSYREGILNTNSYSSENEYELSSCLDNSISTILNVVPQYNSVMSSIQLLSNLTDGSELSRIGSIALGKQMGYGMTSSLASKYIPSVNIENILKSNSPILFKKEDYTITPSIGINKLTDSLGLKTYDTIGNTVSFKVVSSGNTCNYNSCVKDVTGEGQYSLYKSNICKNDYTQSNDYSKCNSKINSCYVSPINDDNIKTNYSKCNVYVKTGTTHRVYDNDNQYGNGNLDPLLRFEGNEYYGGSEDSTIRDYVLPKIHPFKNDGGDIDKTKLMFSIENLAIGTIDNGEYGIIDDEYGSPIPRSEVGNFGGRLMWFPPYEITITETANAKYEQTVMIGRNEPMYNYLNSERSATLSFKLLIDSPEQLKVIGLGNNDINDFYSLGLKKNSNVNNINNNNDSQNIINENQLKINNILDKYKTDVVDDISVSSINIYFPFDEILSDEDVSGYVSLMYNEIHYEINGNNSSGVQFTKNSDGLNSDIYYHNINNNEINVDNSDSWENVDQYVNNNGDYSCDLDVGLKTVFYDNKININYYKFVVDVIVPDNEDSDKIYEQRVEIIKHLLYNRLINILSDKYIVDIEKLVESSDYNKNVVGDDVDDKYFRNSEINIVRNNVSPIKNVENINGVDKKNITTYSNNIRNAKIRLIENSSHLYSENNGLIDDNYDPIKKNTYSPLFNSQTPEDFHKRLTFLHQCTRQGSAKRYDVIDVDGELRARNSVFGKQPICVLKIADFFYTKVIINSITIDYTDAPWDVNPEGFGMQPMMANITLQMNLIGGQSLKGPIDALQNAVSFNYYANSSFSNNGIYARPSEEARKQNDYNEKIKKYNNKY